MTKCKGCRGSDVKNISVMTRPGDVIAGGSGGMGPCPPPQHQPPGIIDIYLIYTGLYQVMKHIPNIYLTYTRYIPFSFGICLVYVWYMNAKNHVI
jgi:hypothetical protein